MKIIIFSIIICSISSFCFGQNNFDIIKADSNACELNSAYFDDIHNQINHDSTAKVVAKFYAGKNETNVVSEKRANYVRIFLEQFKGFDPSRLEFINAGKLATDENPKIEFYVVQAAGNYEEPYFVSYAPLNKTPCLDCCENEKFYPQYIGPKSKKRVRKYNKKRKVRKSHAKSY